MAWNPAGGQHNFSGQFPVNGFPGPIPGPFPVSSGQFVVAPQQGGGNAFGFAPDTMSAFDTSGMNWAAPGAPNFGGPVPQANFGATAFDTSAFGGAIDATAFQAPVFNQPPLSLFDMAHTAAPPVVPQTTVATPQKDLFGDLSISDIKSGYVAPRNPAPITPISTPNPQSTEKKPTAADTPQFHTVAPTPVIASATTSDSSFEWHSTASTPSADLSFPTTPVSVQTSTPTIQNVTSTTPEKPLNPAAPQPHSASEFLASIDLSAKPKPVETPTSATPTSSYSNAGLVKSSIDWSQKRDLMASFLSSTSTQPAAPAETVPAAPVASDSSAEDWSGFGEGTKHDDSAEWSAFDSTSNHTDIDPSSHRHTSHEQTLEQAHTPAPEPVMATEAHPPEAPPRPSSAASAADWAVFMSEATKGAAAITTDAFGFDPSTFDTSAFNFGEISTPTSTNPPPAAATSETLSHGPVTVEPTAAPLTMQKSPSHTEIPATTSNDGFADFGDFSSSGHDADWSAFPDEAPATSFAPDAAIPPLKNLPLPETKSTPTKPVSPKSHRSKILDLDSFTLPTMGTTPVKGKPDALEDIPSEEPHRPSGPIPAEPLLNFAGFESTPMSTTSSISDDLMGLSTTAFSSGATSTTSTSLGGDFSLPVESDLPSWMNSNKSDSVESISIPKTVETPTMDSLRRQVVELLGNDKSAPYLWIFDNMTKQITLSFEDRQALALGLIEDMKSGKSIWVSSSRVNQWHNVLSKCNEELTRACNYLSTVSMQADMHSDDILVSYFQNEKTRSYLESLAKIYRVAQRIAAAVNSTTNPLASNGGRSNQTPKTTCRYLKPSVIKALAVLCSTIETTWQSLSSQISEMEAPLDNDTQSNGDVNDILPSTLLSLSPIVPHAPADHVCFLCYRGFDEHEGPSAWSGQNYHATCANYWIHRVSPKPPSL